MIAHRHRLLMSALLASCALAYALLDARATGTADIPIDAPVAGPPASGPGHWRTKVQQVFDERTRVLSRRVYTAWDAEPSRDLDFVWTPDDPARATSGRIDGTGHLMWRVKGTPAYVRAGMHSEYRGTFKAGRMDGRGAWLHHTGLYYEGEWADGLMHGHGTLKLPGGEEFVGQFRSGRAHGPGRYVEVNGEIFEGPFADGHRHGRGTTTLPGGYTYASRWTQGREARGSLGTRIAQTGPAAAPGGSDDIRIGITIDKRLPQGEGNSNKAAESKGRYAISNSPSGFSIKPSNPRIVQRWKGNGEIQIKSRYDDPDSLDLSPQDLVPLTLNIEVQNRSRTPAQVEGVYLDVQSSTPDLQPAIELKRDSFPSIVNEGYRPILYIANYGWGSAEDAKLHYSFFERRPKELPATFTHVRSLGRIEHDTELNLAADLKAAGVEVAFSARQPPLLQCKAASARTCLRRKSDADFEAGGPDFTKECKAAAQTCLAELKKSGVFGSLTPLVLLDDRWLTLTVAGVLEYTWKDHKGAMTSMRRPFFTDIAVGVLRVEDGMIGEGGDRQIISAPTQKLQLDASNYRIPVAYKSSIANGRTGRLAMSIEADKSSNHDFAVVVQLADGRQIRSRPINLLYYNPNVDPDDNEERTYKGYELVGGDLTTLAAEVDVDCTGACLDDGSCIAYSYRERDKKCVLKSSIGTLRQDPEFTSYRHSKTPVPAGFVPKPEPAPPTMGPILSGRAFSSDHPGPIGIHMRSNLDECQRLCAREQECRAFTFWRTSQNCVLHDEDQNLRRNPDADSGRAGRPKK